MSIPWSASRNSTRCAKPRTRNCNPTRNCSKRFLIPMFYLALLLHDTGKGVAARPHSEASALFAQGVAVRLQLSSERRRSLVLLVDHHLTLSNMAQQRNVDDPATVIEFANIVKSQSNLDALMLLTLSDGQGTTDTWSDWKESLVWNLYHATARYLQDQEGFIAQVKIERDRLRNAVAENSRSILPMKLKPISITCRIIISGHSTPMKSGRISISSALFGGRFICGTSRPSHPLSSGRPCRSRATAWSRSAPGTASIFWPASPARSRWLR